MKHLLAALAASAALATVQVASAQGPQPVNYLDQLQCNFNPEGCQAWQEGKAQEATYRALWQRGATHEEALAGALNPQYLQALLPALEARRQQSTGRPASGYGDMRHSQNIEDNRDGFAVAFGNAFNFLMNPRFRYAVDYWTRTGRIPTLKSEVYAPVCLRSAGRRC